MPGYMTFESELYVREAMLRSDATFRPSRPGQIFKEELRSLLGTKIFLCHSSGFKQLVILMFCGEFCFKIAEDEIRSFIYSYHHYALEIDATGVWNYSRWVEAYPRDFLRWQEVGF